MTKKKAVKSRTRKAVKTCAQWAAEIRAAHKQSIEGILKMGRTLIAAKKALDKHGAFEKMIENDLPFDASTAQRLMKIARDPRLRKAAHGQLLPGSWRTLYELTKLSDETFERAVSSGAINPAMTREQAVRYVTVPVTERITRIVSPMYVSPPKHLKLVTSEPEQHVEEHEPDVEECEPDVVEECEPEEPELDTTPLHEAIAAVEAVVEASSQATRSVASFWLQPPASSQITPDQIREAAHWLEMLADAMEEEERRAS